jgi:hypothetical protein
MFQIIIKTMPKVTESYVSKVKRYQSKFSDVFTVQTNPITNSHILYCQPYCMAVTCDQKSHVDQHLNSKTHREKTTKFKSKQVSV